MRLEVYLTVLSSRIVCVDKRPIALTAQDVVLLAVFLRSPDRVFSRETLIDQMNGEGDCALAAVEHAISRLRRKLREAGAGNIVETVRGVGYRLNTS